MQTTDYIWLNGVLVAWNEAKIHVLTHTLHYGGGAFEGIRVYKTERGAAIFRMSEHINRLFYSATSIKMQIPYTQFDISNAIKELVRTNRLEEGYIRPIAYYGYGKMGVSPIGAPVELAIACWPWGRYLNHDMVDIKTSSYIRVHPRSTVTDAKLTGNYLNNMLAGLELQGTAYHEALLLDIDGYIAEGPGENFFVIKNGAIYTPQLGNILGGITRLTVIDLAKQLGIKVYEQKLTLADVYGADEAFYTGTAAEVTPIRSLDDKVFGQGEIGPITQTIRQQYLDIVHGRNQAYIEHLTLLEDF